MYASGGRSPGLGVGPLMNVDHDGYKVYALVLQFGFVFILVSWFYDYRYFL